jgi:hypothetical protein
MKTKLKKVQQPQTQTHNYMRFTLLTQIALLALSVAIVFLFIKPAFTEIKVIQDNLLVYSDAVAKASDYNSRLNELLGLRDSFSQNDLAKLERFVPSTLDTLVIMHEIEAIFASNDIQISSLSAKDKSKPEAVVYTEGDQPLENEIPEVMTQDFQVSFSGDYDVLKMILGVLESNARLLEIIAVQYGVDPEAPEADDRTALITDDQLFTISLRAYALQAPVEVSPTL